MDRTGFSAHQRYKRLKTLYFFLIENINLKYLVPWMLKSPLISVRKQSTKQGRRNLMKFMFKGTFWPRQNSNFISRIIILKIFGSVDVKIMPDFCSYLCIDFISALLIFSHNFAEIFFTFEQIKSLLVFLQESEV